MSLLFIDIESGNGKSCPLSLYFKITDRECNSLTDLELNVKPDDGLYLVSPKSLNINKINLMLHDESAISYKEASKKIYEFLYSYRIKYGSKKLISIGNGIHHDLEMLTENFLCEKTLYEFLSYNFIDLGSTYRLLEMNGKVKESGYSLEDLYETLTNKKVFDDLLHSGKYDVELGIEVYKELAKIIKS